MHFGTTSAGLTSYVGVGGEVVPGADQFGETFGGLNVDGTSAEAVIFVSARGWAVSEITKNDGWAVKAGVGVGGGATASLGCTLGFLAARLSSGVDRPVIVRTFAGTFGAEPGLELGDFGIAEWTLTPGMRAMVARNLARYLPLLGSPEAILRIEGEASPSGTDEDNEILSWRRALAVYAWIRVLLSRAEQPARGTSTALVPCTDRVAVTGFGELKARTEGRLNDGVEASEWRRAKFVINDQVLVFI